MLIDKVGKAAAEAVGSTTAATSGTFSFKVKLVSGVNDLHAVADGLSSAVLAVTAN